MNIAICDEKKVIKNVIVLDRVPEPVDNDFFAECPAWCWIGDSIDKPKPRDWVNTTNEEQVAQLDLEYEKSKQQLMQYYFEFSIAEDTDGMESIKAELEALNKQYDNDLEALKGSE